jgi:proteasome assembly chaperone (PAC2) family protein
VDGLHWDERPELRDPFLIAAFEGWNDAADAATGAAAWLTARFPSTRCAWIDPELHFDFQSHRPTVELVGGVVKSLTWPANECFSVRIERGPRDLVVLRGIEPNLHWASFCRSVLEVATETRCSMVITLGSLLADVPHTRVAPVTGTATDGELVRRLGLERSRYEGPTGIVGVLHDTCRAAGVASASLWAPVPHYVATPPNPIATRTLLDRLSDLTGLELDLHDLDQLGVAWRTRVDEVIAGDDDVSSYVRTLEARVDAEDDDESDDVELPSGDDIAEQFERYLRERDDEGA